MGRVSAVAPHRERMGAANTQNRAQNTKLARRPPPEGDGGQSASGTGMIGVVKADGYGHGSVPVAMAVDPYVRASPLPRWRRE